MTREGMQRKGVQEGLQKPAGESCIVVVVCEQATTEESCRASGQRQFCVPERRVTDEDKTGRRSKRSTSSAMKIHHWARSARLTGAVWRNCSYDS